MEEVLYRELVKARAWDRLYSPEKSGMLGMDAIRELAIQAGFDERQADKMANARGNARMDHGMTP